MSIDTDRGTEEAGKETTKVKVKVKGKGKKEAMGQDREKKRR